MPTLSIAQSPTTASGPEHPVPGAAVDTCIGTAAGSRWFALSAILLIFGVLYFASLFSPPLLDDADATHASAARHIALAGDWVTLYVNGIRYLEKPPLPYWLVAVDYHLFGYNVFATHLPTAISVLLLSLLAWHWSRSAWNARAGLYAALAVLTSAGVFLFTRIFIPEALLTLLMGAVLFCFLAGLEYHRRWYFSAAAILLALALLTKGLIALVFPLTAMALYLFLTGDWRRWRELCLPLNGLVLLLIAVPWHILAALRNRAEGHPAAVPTFGNHHGFLWFYFINEHWLRFLGQRYPMDYNKLPAALYWAQHIAWLFPWSLFLPLAIIALFKWWNAQRSPRRQQLRTLDFAGRTTLLLSLYATVILLFFSLSTNQEYYTFPAYLPLLMLTAAALARVEDSPQQQQRWLRAAHIVYAVVGLAAAATLGYGLWASRHLAFVPDIGTVLAHRGIGDYTLATSSLFDLTDASFAALRLPASLAVIALAIGPMAAWWLRQRRQHLSSTLAIALSSTLFLFAAHLALTRFAPMLSSKSIADTINTLTAPGGPAPDAQIYLFGDQAYGSSIPFYTGKQVMLVDGESSSMIWGSTYTDAPNIFLSSAQLASQWGTGPTRLLFIPNDIPKIQHDEITALLGNRWFLIEELSGKMLVSDRPITTNAGVQLVQ